MGLQGNRVAQGHVEGLSGLAHTALSRASNLCDLVARDLRSLAGMAYRLSVTH